MADKHARQMRTMVGGMKGSIGATVFVVSIVVSSLGTAWSAAPAFAANVDPSLRAGELALVQTSAGLAGALSAKLETLGATEIQTYTAVDTVVARMTTAALAAIKTDRTVTVASANSVVVALGGGRDRTGFESDEDANGKPNRGQAKKTTAASPDFVSVAAINAPAAWRVSTGKGVTVAVMDTGIAPTPDLPKQKIRASVDFVKDGAKAADPSGHGTHIAGVIAADGTMKGVAPDADLVSIRVLDTSGSGSLSAVVAGFDWLLKHRKPLDIKVLNVSWGAKQTTSYNSDLLSALVEAAWFSGITVVAAAGNGGPAAGTITTPGSDPFVVTAGAFDDAGTVKGGDDRIAPFSSQGPTLDGFAKPDTLAPGVSVWSLRVPGLVYLNGDGEPIGSTSDRYIRQTGTSVSTAFVSGVAALVASARPAYGPTQIKGAIVASGRSVGAAATAVDAAGALTAMTRVNQGLEPSALLMQILTKSGIKVSRKGVTWEGVTWESVTWETVSWEGATWEGVTWETVDYR